MQAPNERRVYLINIMRNRDGGEQPDGACPDDENVGVQVARCEVGLCVARLALNKERIGQRAFGAHERFSTERASPGSAVFHSLVIEKNFTIYVETCALVCERLR